MKCRVSVVCTDDVIIKGLPLDESWILWGELNDRGIKARSGSVPVHFPALPGEGRIVYASVDGGAKRWAKMRRANQ